MNSLTKKMLRDILKNKMQFFSIFIMVFLGVFVFAGIHAYMDGMDVSAKKYYENNNLQDLWISGYNFTKEDMEKIKNTSNINDAERNLKIITELKGYKDVTLETNFIESNNISKMYVVEGDKFSKSTKGAWLDSYIAKELNIKTGDEITLKYKDYEIKEKVIGLVNTPDYVYFVKDKTALFPTHKDYGFVYLSIDEFFKQYIYDELKDEIKKQSSTLDNITNDMVEKIIPNFKVEDYYVFNNVIIDVKDTSKLDETKRYLEENLDSAAIITDRNSNTSYVCYNSEIEEGTTYSNVFTILFLVIAILSVITTMNRFVKAQRTQIGTLKALGFKNSKITRHYISYGFYISLIATILALICGKFILGTFFIDMEMSYFEVPVYSTILIKEVYIYACLVVLLITFVTYMSCRKILKEPAVETLRVERPKVKNYKFSITTKLKKLSTSTKWNLRDIRRNKSRSMMAIVGVAGCTMLIVCALGMLDTMNSYVDWQFNTLNKFSYKLTLSSNYTEDEFEKITKDYGIATSQTIGIEFKIKDEKIANTMVINDAKEYLKYTDRNKNYIDLKEDGIYITEKLSNKYNLNVGNNISWHVFGNDKWYTSKIVGINKDPQNQILNTTKKYYESLDLTYKADTLYTNSDLSKISALDGVETIQSIKQVKQDIESMLNTTKTMVVILIVVSAVLGFVIIYNLGILSFAEKEYQFATLKVLGFKNNQIKDIFVKQNIWLSVIGILIGLPLGYFMIDFIFKSALGDNYDFESHVRIISYVLSVIGTYLVTIFVNYILAKKVNKIDMVMSLKANE